MIDDRDVSIGYNTIRIFAVISIKELIVDVYYSIHVDR